MTNPTIAVPVELRCVLSMILNALDRDSAEGKAARGEMATELRAILAAPPAYHSEQDLGMVEPRPTGLSQGWNLVRQCDGFVIGHSSEEPSGRHKQQALSDGRVYVPFMVEQPSAAQVLEGWKLVPKELTSTMIFRCSLLAPVARRVWGELLSAAPAHPAPRNEQAGEVQRLREVNCPICEQRNFIQRKIDEAEA